MQEALSLSEIRTHIGLFLITNTTNNNKRDLIACMSVCKEWRTDFRRLLYRDLVLGHRTFQPILGPIQWRAYGIHTQSLVLEEPSVMQKVNPMTTRGRYSTMGARGGQGGAKSVLRSSDYNLDPIQYCPNLLHLTIKLSPSAQGLCCWTREDDDDDYGHDDNDTLGAAPPARFRTTVAFRYDRQNQPWFVKSSNRILALLEYHPSLRSFHWVGDSSVHMERIGRHLLSKQPPHRLVDLELDSLTATCAEINRIIENCPELRRLCLRSLHLVSTATWPDLEPEQEISTISIAPTSPTTSSPTLPQATQIQPTLYLSNVQSLTLDRPQFLAPGILKIHGPHLQHLELVDCAFPPSFLTEINRARLEGSPLALVTPHVVEWNCPMLTRFKHDRGSLMPEAFSHNLLSSAKTSFRSLVLLKLTLQPTFVTDLITHPSVCQLLTHLDLSGSERIKSTELQSLLCHLPALLDFKGPAGVLWGEDVFHSPKPWACLKLQKLQMLICLARPDSGLWESDNLFFGFPLWDALPADSNRFLQVQKAVFLQLGKLTELEVVDLSGGYGIEQFLHEVPRGLPWTLEAGLETLQGLKRMRELTVSGWENKMTRKEAQWFRQWWPELRTIRTKNDGAFSRRSQSQAQQQQRQQLSHQQQQQEEVEKPVSEELVVGWLAFQMCLHQEWPERFPDPMI
ncbi:hypothetical protein K457DRAFT_341551 [Linnemannia elongata AG-77]|uniref:F-box domain-containing protein n=1 Tax=Linnemannia elongata AG-77 TaxID=1314771 RepID=A0A197K3D9_9FUNG|nr:hypothetical protein K457DRAFT_341551 [Linnemannia elongata AG-77]